MPVDIAHRLVRRALLAVAAVTFAVGLPLPAQSRRPTTSDESLLLGDIPSVFGASRFDQAITEAPASVTVITAEEIATYGWRTLAEVLRSVRGFYVTDDRAYSYIGTRGFGREGDYNTRLLILVDGVRFNENIYDGGYVAAESAVDIDNIDRVEVIRGPGSSLYGTNAFLGIVSITTVRGRARSGVRVRTDLERFNGRALALSAGHRLGSGIDFYASARVHRTDGRDFFFPEFTDSANRGVASGVDAERRNNAFAKVEWGAFTLSSNINLRTKHLPTAPYGVSFDDGRMAYTDNIRNVALRYHREGQDGSSLSGALSATRYDFEGMYPYGSENHQEWSHGRWGIADVQYTRRFGERHRAVFGGTYTHNAQQRLLYGGGAPFVTDFDVDTTADTWALFAVGESRFGEHLIANYGLRRDYANWLGANWNPHAGLIWTFDRSSAIKLLYGSAFRAPNSYERFYNDEGVTQKANTGLRAEHVRTIELLAERRLTRHLKGNVSLYNYEAKRLIDRWTDPGDGLIQFRNVGHVDGQGVEGEVEFDFARLSGRASYALQHSIDQETKATLSNSPRHLATLNVATPLVPQRLQGAVQLRAMSARLARDGSDVGGNLVADVHVSTLRPVKGVGVALGMRNVLGRRYEDPIAEEYLPTTLRQEPRVGHLSLTWSF